MELYLHCEGTAEIRRIPVPETATVEALLAEHASQGASAWLEDAEEPLDASSSLAAAGVADRAHIHLSRCRRIAVTVRFAGQNRTRDFAPGATVNRVFVWAAGRQGFGLPADQRATHTLGRCGEEAEADRDDHLGSLANDCALCFDLAPKVRYAG